MDVIVRPRVGSPKDLEDAADETAQARDGIQFENVVNVENRHDLGEWPKIRVEQADGSTHTFEYATVDVSDTEPALTATVMEDTTPSIEYQQVTTYECYGVWAETYTDDTFGKTRVSHRLFIEDDGPVVLGPHDYRGILVRYPNGDNRVYGDMARHSRSARHHFDVDGAYEPPFATSDGTITIETSRGTLHNATNVRRVDIGDSFKYDVEVGPNTIRVDEIHDATGPCFSACVKHDSSFGHGTTTTTVQRAIGLYVDDSKFVDGYALSVIGFPSGAGIYKKPQKHRIATLDEIHAAHIKMPDGTIQQPDFSVLDAGGTPTAETPDSEDS